MSEQNIRRQQGHDQDPSYEDPLAELARIVSGEDSEPAASSAPTLEETWLTSTQAEQAPAAPEENFAEDLSLSEPVQAVDDLLETRYAEENMDLESQLMAELSTAPVPQVSKIPEPPQRPASDFATEAPVEQMPGETASSEFLSEATADVMAVGETQIDGPADSEIEEVDFTAAFSDEFEHSPAAAEPNMAQPEPGPETAIASPATDYTQLERQVDHSVQEIRSGLAQSMDIEDAFSDVFANELSREIAGEQGDTAHQPQTQVDYIDAEGELAHGNDYSNPEQLQIDPSQDAVHPAGKKSSGFKMAAVALGLAILTGSAVVGYGLLGEKMGSDEPVLVRADQSDFKVKPEEPGGKKITNQDQPVYDTMDKANLASDANAVSAGTEPGNISSGTQDRLLANDEAPVELASRSTLSTERPLNSATTQPAETAEKFAGDSNLPETNTPIAFVQPRKVKTVSVRADGSIVTSISSGPLAIASSNPATDTSQPLDAAVDGALSTGKIAIPVRNPKTQEISAQKVVTNTIKSAASGTLSNNVLEFGAPLEPVNKQPVALASTSNTQTRLLAPSTAAYAVQISSQRSLEAAEASYQNLKRRFANLLSDKPREIREGKLEGKGTFYRVRIPFEEKAAAGEFCSNYKSAGGSCFVTR